MHNNDTPGHLAGTRVCMVTYEYYPKDQRVRREAGILVQNGARVDVISLKGHSEKIIDRANSINIFRVPMKKKKSEGGGFLMYFFGYLSFIILSTTTLLWLFLIKRYKIIHVHSMPDFLVFCALVPKLLGAKIILDLHELTPEVYATKFKTSLESSNAGISKVIERSSAIFADTVITTNDFRTSIIKKRTQKESVLTYMNLPMLSIFKKIDMSKFVDEHDLVNSFIVLYIGELDPEREIDVALKAIKYVEDRIPNVKLLICGTGQEDYINFVNRTIMELKLDEKVLNIGLVPLEDILNYVELADVAISPYKPNPNADAAFSTKVFEYLLVPKPVILSDLKLMSKELRDMVIFYDNGDPNSLGTRILEVHDNEEQYKEMAINAKRIMFERFDPKGNDEKLVEIYKNLLIK